MKTRLDTQSKLAYGVCCVCFVPGIKLFVLGLFVNLGIAFDFEGSGAALKNSALHPGPCSRAIQLVILNDKRSIVQVDGCAVHLLAVKTWGIMFENTSFEFVEYRSLMLPVDLRHSFADIKNRGKCETAFIAKHGHKMKHDSKEKECFK